MTKSNKSVYFNLQARATQLANDVKFGDEMADALFTAALTSGMSIEVRDDLQKQAADWQYKARDAQASLDSLKESAASCGFTLHT